jgi:hypothetical protein
MAYSMVNTVITDKSKFVPFFVENEVVVILSQLSVVQNIKRIHQHL